MKTKERMALTILVTVEGDTRQILRFFVTSETTVGEIMKLEELLNKLAAPAEFEIKSNWENVP